MYLIMPTFQNWMDARIRKNIVSEVLCQSFVIFHAVFFILFALKYSVLFCKPRKLQFWFWKQNLSFWFGIDNFASTNFKHLFNAEKYDCLLFEPLFFIIWWCLRRNPYNFGTQDCEQKYLLDWTSQIWHFVYKLWHAMCPKYLNSGRLIALSNNFVYFCESSCLSKIFIHLWQSIE